MARVKGPLFSLDASGQVGEAIVYSQWKGINYVREYEIPSNPNTAGQINVRTAWSLLVSAWQALAPADQLAWDEYAEAFKMSGFNKYLSNGLKAYVLQLTTAVTPVSVVVVGLPPSDVWTWT